MKTKIEWADRVWNPITGCSHSGSPGCDNCYARRMAQRLKGRCGYPEDEPFRVALHLDRLNEPLSWRKPQRVFVCSMGDLFHEDVPDWLIFSAWRTMVRSTQHIFMLLTKRPERMREWFLKLDDAGPVDAPPVMWRGDKRSGWGTDEEAEAVLRSGRCQMFEAMVDTWGMPPDGCSRPTYDWQDGERWWQTVQPNIWLGVTAENQEQADKRIPILLQIPAAKRFVSVEPMLEFININWSIPALSWVIFGAETGPGKRPMNLDWARSLRDQCFGAGLPFFFKKDSEGRHTLDGIVHEEFPYV